MESTFDVIIVGGGAAGIMAAISCKRAHPTYSICIVDRTFALGRKILVCGAGRCNITNVHLNESIEDHYYGAPHTFVRSIFEQFGLRDIVSFFNDLGVELYVERKTDIGKLFPITDQAKTINALLEDELKRLGVTIMLTTDCLSIERKGERFEVTTQLLENNIPKGNTSTLSSAYVVISAGGRTYPALGSNGSGYALAEKFGHAIIGPVPSALPLVGKNPLSQELQGVKLEIEVTSIIDGKRLKTRSDDVMFAQYGITGPAVLNVSREISIQINRLHKGNCAVSLNFFPGKTSDDVHTLLSERWLKRPDQSIEVSLLGFFPVKVPAVLLKLSGIDKNKAVQALSEREIETLIATLTAYLIPITETRGWNEAEFTAGGVDTGNVKAGTLESTLVPHLYFCGEVLDVDGDVGGFNLSWAWASGNIAGKLQ